MPKVNALSDVDPTAITLVKKGANGQRIFLKKQAEDVDLIKLPRQSERILKDSAGTDWSVLYCVVAEPDAQELPGLVGDGETLDVWASPDEIRKAAHRLLKNGAFINLQHDGLPESGLSIVENAVALADFDVYGPDGEAVTIKKGSWYVGIEVDDTVKQAVDSGDIEAISMEAMGVRTLIEKAAASTDRDNSLKRAFKAMADALFPGENVVPDAPTEIQKALAEAPTFGNLIAKWELNDELPRAIWALEDAIYYAFDPLYGDGQGEFDPRELLDASFAEFAAWASALIEKITPEKRQALQKEAGRLRKNRPTQEDSDVPISDKDFEDLRKEVTDLTALVKEHVTPPEPKDPPEPVQKTDDDSDIPDWAQRLMKSVEQLGEGRSTQTGVSEADLAELKKTDPERYDALMLLGQ